MTDENLESIAYGLWCVHKKFGYYAHFCDALAKHAVPGDFEIVGIENLPVIAHGNRLIHPGEHPGE